MNGRLLSRFAACVPRFTVVKNNSNIVRTITFRSAVQPLSRDQVFYRCFSKSLCKQDYEKFSDTTLDSLTEFFDEVAETCDVPSDFDVICESGVLTICVSQSVGTYVINKQAPNKQIWLSSPISGPKRYDFVDGSWKYLNDGKYLYQLLEEEFSQHLKVKVDLSKLPFYTRL